MLTLKTTETAIVKHRATLPAWIEPKGAAFIEIDGRPAGRINQAFMAARERIDLARRIREAGAQAITDPGEAVKAKDEAGSGFARDWYGVVYDTCVVGWRTNLLDGETGKPLTCDRDTFMALVGVPIAEVSQVFLSFQAAILEAGKQVEEDTEATIKN